MATLMAVHPQVRDTVALVDGKLAGDVIGTEESIADVVTKAMQELGQLRRMLAGLVQQWSAALAEGEAACRPDAPRSLRDRALSAGTPPPSSAAGRNDSKPARMSAHAAAAPASSYAAPKLDAGGQEESLPSDSRPPQEEIIPAGLVARYVSMFEDQRSAVGSTRGSPWSSSAEGAAAARHVDTGYNSRAAGGVRADQTAELPKVVVGFQRTEPPLSHPLVAHEGECACFGLSRCLSRSRDLSQLVVRSPQVKTPQAQGLAGQSLS